MAKARRLSTGRFQDEGDWPGYFIRGDDCIQVAAAIRKLVDYYHGHGFPEELTSPTTVLFEHLETIEREVLVQSQDM